MKRKQITAILLSAIMTVSACMPMNSISALAAEASGAGNTETAAVVEMQEEEAPAEEAEPDTAVAAQEVQEEQSVEAEPAAEPEESGEEATEAEPAVEEVTEEEEKAEAVVVDASAEDAAAQNEEPAVEAAEEETAEPAAEEAPAAETAVEADDQAAEADQAEAADQKADTAKEAAVVEETTETDKGKEAKNWAESPSDFDNAIDLEVGDSMYFSYSTDGYKVYYRIVPDETAQYRMYAADASDTSYNSYGVLYNSDFNSINWGDDENGSHFQIEHILVAGRTYYLEVGIYNDIEVGDCNVYLEKEDEEVFYQEGDYGTVYFDPGDVVTLSVYAYSSIGEIEYSWTDENGNEIAVNTSQYTYKPTGGETIYCTATDGSQSAFWMWNFVVDNHLSIQSAGDTEYLVGYGEPCTLETTVSARDMSELTYSWFKWEDYSLDWEIIEGAEEASFTIGSVVSNGLYRCAVSDQYAGSASTEFYVRIDNHFRAFTYHDYGNGEIIEVDTEVVEVELNKSATLSVTVEADDMEGITYIWYKNDELIEGADSAEYITGPVTGRDHYYCDVSDKYGNEQLVNFHVSIDNHFNAYTFDDDGEYQTNYKDIYTPPNEAVTMSVTVEADDPEGITFSWYKDYEQIEGADSAEYTTEPVTARATYYCHVEDKYGNSNDIYFYVFPVNHFSAYTLEEMGDGDYYRTSYTSVYVTPNETSTLSVIVEADDPEGVTYTWYKNDEFIEGADSAEYTTEPVTLYNSYYCRIEDKYGNSSSVTFYVHPENHFRAYTLTEDEYGNQEATGYTDVFVTPNEPFTLSVIVEADDMDGITYSWEKDYEPIEGADSAEYTAEPLNGKVLYTCDVEDKYGNNEHIVLYVYPQNHFRAYTFQDGSQTNHANLYVTPNETVTLSVTVEADDSEGITYGWLKDEQVIDGANSAEWITEPITGNCNYLCAVRDKYGSTQYIDFYIHPENHLNAEPVWAEGEEVTDARSVYVTPGTTTTLEVSVEADDLDGITYNWYKDYEPIDGADSAEYTTDPVNGRAYYYCEVRDKYGNWDEVYFYVYAQNHFKAYPAGDDDSDRIDLICKPKQDVTLQVVVEADDKTGLTYSWYKSVYDSVEEWYSDSEPIEGADADHYTVTARSKERYRCDVNDQYGNSQTIWFYISVDNELKVYPEGTDGDQLDLTIQPGESATLRTIVEANDPEGITYRWEYYSEEIEGQNTDTYTGASKFGYYTCTVTDAYGNQETAYFFVTVDNDFQLRQEGNSAIINGTRTIYVQPGQESIDLNVSATATVQDGITYQWYKDYEPIEGAEGSTYTADCDRDAVYECKAHDAYGSEGSAVFRLIVNNRFSAYIDNGQQMETVTSILTTELVGKTLKVKAFAADMNNIHYQWEFGIIDEGDYRVVGTDSDSYTIKEEDLNQEFNNIICTVTDGYGHEKLLRFLLEAPANPISETFSVYPEGAVEEEGEYNNSVNIYLRPSENEATLKVIATGAGAQGLSYEWSIWDDDEWCYRPIGENADTYRASVTGDAEYRCLVTNEEGESHVAWFYVNKDFIDVRVKGTSSSSKTIELASPGNVTLEVEAEASDPETITYEWYKDEKIIPNEKGSSLSVNVTGSAVYECRVSDGDYAAHAQFFVKIGSLTASCGNSDFEFRYSGSDSKTYYINAAPGQTITIPTIAESTNSGALTYKWTYYGQLLSTNSSYSLQATESDYYLTCTVEDSLGNIFRVYYRIYVNHFSAQAESETVYYNPDNSDGCILKVITAGDDLNNVEYKWYCWDNDQMIAQGTDSVTVNPGTRQEYYCRVKDAFGNYQYIDFVVRVDSGLNASPKDQTIGTYDAEMNLVTVKATEGQAVTLSTVAENVANTDITYIWYSHDLSDPNADMEEGWKLEDASGDTLSITADKNTRYNCIVVDKYGCSDTLTFDVYTSEVKTLQQAVITLSQDEYVYNGTQRKPAVTVTYQNIELTQGTDYQVSYGSNINAGEGTVTITGLGEFSDSDPVTKTFMIDKAQQNLSAADLSIVAGATGKISVTGAQGALSYESKNTAVVTVGSDGTVTAAEDASGKSAIVRVSAAATDNYEAKTISVTVTVVKQKAAQTISAENITLEVGSSAKIAVTGAQGALSYASDNTSVVTVGADGTVTAAAGAAGKSAKITVTAAETADHKAGSTTLTVSVKAIDVSPTSANASKLTVTAGSGLVYNGKEQKPAITVAYNGKALKAGTDYDVKYKEAAHVNAGTYTVYVVCKGNYSGTREVKYTIAKAAQAPTAAIGGVNAGQTGTFVVVNPFGTVTVASKNTGIATATISGKTVTVKGVAPGTATISITAAGDGNHTAKTITCSVKVFPAATRTFKAANVTGKGIKLTWAQVAGANGYIIYRNNKKIKTISGGSTKTYTDTGANTNGTKYTYKIYAKAASGTSTLYKSVIMYKLSRPAVKSLSNSASKKMTVKWAKNAKANGYQIQYGLKSNFSGAKTTKITKNATLSKVIGSLKKGKTYYVRIRTYKTVSGKTYYSAWSASKKVKISK